MTTRVRRRMGVDERGAQLIGVALELFAHRSPDEVSIDEIAAAAGISRPLVHHYFPGKQSLYEAALGRAADELAGRFAEAHEGPLGARLLRVMVRFFDFVEEHGPGFSALLRGGPPSGSSTADAVIDGVREAAYGQILSHLQVVSPPPARLELLVRSWVSLAESTALLWLDGRRVPRAELESQLVQDFAALAWVSAAHDRDMAAIVLRVFSREPPDGPFGDLLGRLSALAPSAAPAVPPRRTASSSDLTRSAAPSDRAPEGQGSSDARPR
ncbi:TetR/AcrR family transcriptional regulator [Streptomyces sp. NBC_01754]|uniref:TetR/AcrR family transcriptional regulator n=1 Tax=Streptomyces sp. NBC_01754 TaxID=2975930 RepID=UPI002DD81223|nr:TetR/AcrR family transcriptional regulator [Streptomyces sp. NBC_01754]WSC92126.1 TetR/AcrR family transcriptional regulator [Streptomyces sp. NBC_01754]